MKQNGLDLINKIQVTKFPIQILNTIFLDIPIAWIYQVENQLIDFNPMPESFSLKTLLLKIFQLHPNFVDIKGITNKEMLLKYADFYQICSFGDFHDLKDKNIIKSIHYTDNAKLEKISELTIYEYIQIIDKNDASQRKVVFKTIYENDKINVLRSIFHYI